VTEIRGGEEEVYCLCDSEVLLNFKVKQSLEFNDDENRMKRCCGDLHG